MKINWFKIYFDTKTYIFDMLRQRKEKAVQKKKDLDSNRDKNVKIR